MKTWKYLLYLLVSLLITAGMLLKGFVYLTPFQTVFVDFLAMLGGGFFCSVAVSWLIERQNKAKEKRDREQQRKFIFASVSNSFIRVYERELSEISIYYGKYCAERNLAMVREDLALTVIAERVLQMLDGIEADEKKKLEEDIIIISTESMECDKAKKRNLVTHNAACYAMLLQRLEELSTLYNTYYISGLLTEQEIEVLKALTWDVKDILLFEPESGIDDGTILVLKRMFFEKANQYMLALDISNDDKVRVSYRDVFSN